VSLFQVDLKRYSGCLSNSKRSTICSIFFGIKNEVKHEYSTMINVHFWINRSATLTRVKTVLLGAKFPGGVSGLLCAAAIKESSSNINPAAIIGSYCIMDFMSSFGTCLSQQQLRTRSVSQITATMESVR
jgi:hypothetical protein